MARPLLEKAEKALGEEGLKVTKRIGEQQEVVRLKTYCNKELDNIVNIYNGHLQGVLFSEVHCNRDQANLTNNPDIFQ